MSRALNLRQGIVMKTSFEIRVSRMGAGSFVDINIFVMKYYVTLFSFFIFSVFFESHKKIYTNFEIPKRKLEGFINDTHLNFGLKGWT